MNLGDFFSAIKVHLVLVAVQLCFALWNFVAPILIHESVNPLVFALYRDAAASAIMIIVILALGYGPKDVDRVDYFRFFMLGLCSFVNQISITYALEYLVGPDAMVLSSSRTSMYFMITALAMPLLASTLSMFKYLERITLMKVLGLWFAAAGATVVIFYSHAYLPAFETTIAADSSSTISQEQQKDALGVGTGVCFAIVHCLSLSALMVFQVPLVLKYTPLHVTSVYYSVGTVLSLLVVGTTAFITSLDRTADAHDSTGAAVSIFTVTPVDFVFQKQSTYLALAYAVLFVALLPYNALSWSASYVPPSISTLYHCTEPLLLAMCAFVYIFFGLGNFAYSGTAEPDAGTSGAFAIFSMEMCLGAAVLFVGVVLAVLGRYFEVQENQRNRLLNSVSAIRTHMSHINVNTGWDSGSDDEAGGALDGLGDISFSFQPSEQQLLGFGLGAYSAENYEIEMNGSPTTHRQQSTGGTNPMHGGSMGASYQAVHSNDGDDDGSI